MHHMHHNINNQSESNKTIPPFLVSFAITNKCNLKCKHCYSDSTEIGSADELTTEEAKKVLSDIAKWGIHLLIFDGGEPLLRNDFFDLAKFASQNGIRVVIGSNGILIDNEIVSKLKDSGVSAVQISIDGATPETHDWFRGEKGAFKKAIDGARACKENGLPFQFGMTLRKGTLNEVKDMLKLAIDEGANAAEFFDLVQVSRVKKEIPGEILSIDERKQVMEWLAEAQSDCPIIIRVPGCPMYTLILQNKNIETKHFPSHMLKRIPYYGRGCAAGMPCGYLTILHNGDIIPCMLLQTKLGNIRKDNIIELWNDSEILSQLRNRTLLTGKCGSCLHRDICAGCRGRAYETTGNITGEDAYCWFDIQKH